MSPLRTEPDMAVSVKRCRRVWRDYGYNPDVGVWMPHGPAGFKFVLNRFGDSHPSQAPHGSVIVSQAEHDGVEWIHASLAWRDYTPTYDQLKILHESVFGRKRTAYQVFAAASDHVNIHEFALHLWGRADGASVLPDFGSEGTI